MYFHTHRLLAYQIPITTITFAKYIPSKVSKSYLIYQNIQWNITQHATSLSILHIHSYSKDFTTNLFFFQFCSWCCWLRQTLFGSKQIFNNFDITNQLLNIHGFSCSIVLLLCDFFASSLWPNIVHLNHISCDPKPNIFNSSLMIINNFICVLLFLCFVFVSIFPIFFLVSKSFFPHCVHIFPYAVRTYEYNIYNEIDLQRFRMTKTSYQYSQMEKGFTFHFVLLPPQSAASFCMCTFSIRSAWFFNFTFLWRIFNLNKFSILWVRVCAIKYVRCLLMRFVFL